MNRIARPPRDRSRLLWLAVLILSSHAHGQRVVSLAPGVTEIVFALQRGDRLVGVTKYCDFPPAARRIPAVGGLLDVHIEALTALAPDVVIAYPENAGRLRFLAGKTRVLTVRHNRLQELLASIRQIGSALHANREADELLSRIHAELSRVRARYGRKPTKKVLCIAGRNAADLRSMIIIGNQDFLSDLFPYASGKNAYRGAVSYPTVSLESVIRLNPQAILEISSHYEGIPETRIVELWRPYSMIAAVAERRVHVVTDSFWLRPGPRVGQIAAALAAILHGREAGL